MALTFSTLRKPANAQVVDPSTGRMREEWQLYFDQLTTRLNAAVSELETGPAPDNAEYIVGAASSALSAERVITDSTSIAWDVATPGQVEARRAALTGDVTASANSNGTTIADNAVSYAKMQDISATSRLLGRRTAGAGDPEECTLSEVLDFIGSAAQGDILYRGASSWARLAAGTSGRFLQTLGAGANPQWAQVSSYTLGTEQATTSGTSFDFTGIGATATRIQVLFNEVGLSGSDHALVRIGDSGGIENTGYTSMSGGGGSSSGSTTNSTGYVLFYGNNVRSLSGIVTLVRMNGSNLWCESHSLRDGDSIGIFGGGVKTLSATLDRIQIAASGANSFDSGSINVLWE